jgi:hypothetical protein
MDREVAERECKRLQAEHPDRTVNTWIVREHAAGEYEVVRVPLPPGMKRDPLKASVETKPKPPQSDAALPWQSAGGVPPNVGSV